jgi:uroporphyrinogen decarboxylase
MAEQARRLSTTTDKVLVLRTRARILEVGHALRGWDRFMMDLMAEPALAQAVLEKALAHHLDNLARMLDAVGGYIHVVMIADDLGSQNGPLISPKLYQKMIKPYHRQLIEFIKARSGLPVFLHNCGSIYRILPDLVEIGVDILNPVQFTARDMQPERLKGEFGKDLVFWGGGADTQNVLPFGTPAQVREHVRRQIEIFAPGGGFVFNPVHNIQAAVPPENVIAMYETALEYGKY